MSRFAAILLTLCTSLLMGISSTAEAKLHAGEAHFLAGDFGWNAKNELVRARTKNYLTESQGYDLSFAYDAEGRRFRKAVTRYASGQMAERKVITYVWYGWDLLYERQEEPGRPAVLERKYVWGPDIGDGSAGGAGGLMLIRETVNGQTKNYYPLYDGSGHLTALTDSSKALQASYVYGPFGEQIQASGPQAASNPWRYATKYYDSETGLYSFGKRYYDPVTGQWLSREPLGESQSVNLYSYCHNDPVNRVDVLGLAEVAVQPEIVNGLPAILYEEWEGKGLSYLWNATAGGKVKRWYQAPNAGQLARNFYMEGGAWRVASAGARRNSYVAASVAAIPGQMEEIRPLMKTMEVGTAVIASAPFVWAGGSALVGSGLLTEAGAGTYVYGGHLARTALANPWVAGAARTGLAAMAAGTGYGVLTSEEFRDDYVAMEMSSPIPGEGMVLGFRQIGAVASDVRAGGAAAWSRLSKIPRLNPGNYRLVPGANMPLFGVPAVEYTGSASERANIALGSRFGNLRKFASNIGANHLLDVPENQWKQAFLDHLSDPSTDFHVHMNGFFGDSPAEMILNEIKSGSNTGWELKNLQEAGRLSQVKFYLSGQTTPIPNPFVE